MSDAAERKYWEGIKDAFDYAYVELGVDLTDCDLYIDALEEHKKFWGSDD